MSQSNLEKYAIGRPMRVLIATQPTPARAAAITKEETYDIIIPYSEHHVSNTAIELKETVKTVESIDRGIVRFMDGTCMSHELSIETIISLCSENPIDL